MHGKNEFGIRVEVYMKFLAIMTDDESWTNEFGKYLRLSHLFFFTHQFIIKKWESDWQEKEQEMRRVSFVMKLKPSSWKRSQYGDKKHKSHTTQRVYIKCIRNYSRGSSGSHDVREKTEKISTLYKANNWPKLYLINLHVRIRSLNILRMTYTTVAVKLKYIIWRFLEGRILVRMTLDLTWAFPEERGSRVSIESSLLTFSTWLVLLTCSLKQTCLSLHI